MLEETADAEGVQGQQAEFVGGTQRAIKLVLERGSPTCHFGASFVHCINQMCIWGNGGAKLLHEDGRRQHMQH